MHEASNVLLQHGSNAIQVTPCPRHQSEALKRGRFRQGDVARAALPNCNANPVVHRGLGLRLGRWGDDLASEPYALFRVSWNFIELLIICLEFPRICFELPRFLYNLLEVPTICFAFPGAYWVAAD